MPTSPEPYLRCYVRVYINVNFHPLQATSTVIRVRLLGKTPCTACRVPKLSLLSPTTRGFIGHAVIDTVARMDACPNGCCVNVYTADDGSTTSALPEDCPDGRQPAEPLSRRIFSTRLITRPRCRDDCLCFLCV